MLSNIDHTIFYFFNQTLANTFCDGIVKFFIQVPGQSVIVICGILALFLGKKYLKYTALIYLSSYTIAMYTYRTIKSFVKRPRPFHVLDNVRLILGERGGYSFPSGHSTIAFCLATVIAMRYPKFRYPAILTALFVAMSRPYIGVHYPSDILVGSILGIFIGYFATKIANKVESKQVSSYKLSA